jgi:hypothetical protein
MPERYFFAIAPPGAGRSASWPWRDMSMLSPRMRSASCGAWKPVEFSASTKSS